MQVLGALLWRRIALAALLLNGAWEFVQCRLFYEMNGGWMQGWLWMLGAVLADVVLVLGVFWGAAVLVGRQRVEPPDGRGWCALLGIGLIFGLLVEWAARSLGLWRYGPQMPTVNFFGVALGLAPLVQMLLLPAFSVRIATGRRPTEGERSWKRF